MEAGGPAYLGPGQELKSCGAGPGPRPWRPGPGWGPGPGWTGS